MSEEIRKEVSRDVLASELGSSVESHIAWYQQMQAKQPVRYRPEYDLWEVFRYKDVQQVLLDHATFSSEKSEPEGFPGALTMSDPPQHRRMRSLVSKAFTPRRIEEQMPHLVHSVDELLEPAIAGGKMDVATSLAYPLPMHTIAEMLGLPPEDQERFLQWSYQLFRQVIGVWRPENSELIQYLANLLDERKCHPQNDLMSGLLAAEENGTSLTREEIIHMCLELMFAGNITTTMLLNLAIQRLCLHPEIYQELRDDPSLIPGAIEETLRYDFSSANLWRTARHDTVLSGQQIKAGQRVAVWISAANFDEDYFRQAAQFAIRRSPNPHLTFGYGIHFCLGAPLARLEGRVALERIVAHFSEIRLDAESPVQYMDAMGSSKLIRSLGVIFARASP